MGKSPTGPLTPIGEPDESVEQDQRTEAKGSSAEDEDRTEDTDESTVADATVDVNTSGDKFTVAEHSFIPLLFPTVLSPQQLMDTIVEPASAIERALYCKWEDNIVIADVVQTTTLRLYEKLADQRVAFATKKQLRTWMLYTASNLAYEAYREQLRFSSSLPPVKDEENEEQNVEPLDRTMAPETNPEEELQIKEAVKEIAEELAIIEELSSLDRPLTSTERGRLFRARQRALQKLRDEGWDL